ncbi:MAG: ATP-dependent helicase, partial [Eggerthellaceae bacterium]|nr:ATP-dependent helicase [Eggerthellaceae bacterium]
DTNALAYLLLNRFVDEKSRIYMFGDPFQRVYGFIGAMPDFMKAATADLGLVREELEVNHRFDLASPMFLLERNLRSAIREPFSQHKGKVASIPLAFLNSIDGESDKATNITEEIVIERPGSKVAVLTRFRESEFSTLLARKLTDAGVEYFDALFLDDEEEYVQFNQMCLGLLKRESSSTGALASKRLDLLFESMADRAREAKFGHVESYCSLLEALRRQLREELPGVGQAERIEYLASIFEERSLRHALEYVPANVIMTTMHASKGLEWDYVILPEMMQWVVPGWGACKACTSSWGNTIDGYRCRLSGNWEGSSLKDEMKLFYVAVTRARRSVFCLATIDRVNSSGVHKKGFLSCFLSMPGIDAKRIVNIKKLI